MTVTKTSLTFPLALALTACGTIADGGNKPDVGANLQIVANGIFKTADGANIGFVELYQSAGTIHIRAEVNGLSEGQRGFHLHQSGTCEGPSFTSAGGHLNPLGNSHGSKSPGGSHLGDLPNLSMPASRQATLEAPIAGNSDEVRDWIFDGDGTAVMIHAEPDDYETDPTGAAGARVACAVLMKV